MHVNEETRNMLSTNTEHISNVLLCVSGPFNTFPKKFNDSGPLDHNKNKILHFIANDDLLSVGVSHQDLKESINKLENVALKNLRNQEPGA